MAPATQLSLLSRSWQETQTAPSDMASQLQCLQLPELYRRQPFSQPQCGVNVSFDVQVTSHVRSGKAELARPRYDPTYGIGRSNDDGGRRIRGSDGRSVEGLEPDRQIRS
jgi:hypothetical protein